MIYRYRYSSAMPRGQGCYEILDTDGPPLGTSCRRTRLQRKKPGARPGFFKHFSAREPSGRLFLRFILFEFWLDLDGGALRTARIFRQIGLDLLQGLRLRDVLDSGQLVDEAR